MYDTMKILKSRTMYNLIYYYQFQNLNDILDDQPHLDYESNVIHTFKIFLII